jgi:hypothetical protein
MQTTEFIGQVELGQTLNLDFSTTNGSGTPTAPSAAPTYTIYGSSIAMTNGTGSASVLSGTVYRIALTPTAANQYERGRTYTVVVQYTASVAKGETYTFLVT